jgi:NAD+ synthetase
VIVLDIDLSIDVKEVSIIIKDFIKTYVQNSGCKGVVIGLSGGVDSAVTAVLCKEALGNKNVKCLFLPDDTTPDLDIKHYQLIVKKFGLSSKKKEISKIVKEISLNCIIKPDKLALANIKARARMIVLFEYANMTNNLVCGTSNKSEILVGQATKQRKGLTQQEQIDVLKRFSEKELIVNIFKDEKCLINFPEICLYKAWSSYKHNHRIILDSKKKYGCKMLFEKQNKWTMKIISMEIFEVNLYGEKEYFEEISEESLNPEDVLK